MRELSAILAIAHRDFIKLIRDRPRIIADLAFPLIFIGILGSSLQAGYGSTSSINLLTFVFTGVLAQTVWQSAALGVISLIADREQDYSQEMFVSPVSRYAIIAGKILGESLVTIPQAAAILAFGAILGVPINLPVVLALIPVIFVLGIFGGAFGVIVLSNLKSQQAANQIFPFVMLPQFFLAGVFNPIGHLPWYLDVISHISPMRYAIDLLRNVYYGFLPESVPVAIDSAPVNLAVIGAMFVGFMLVGTTLFVRSERNR
ncbi:MAG TPA: ABC transporter permease [Candidatus Limnocylindrales bacterium]|jgi:ABC-2 type transport system permease protein|nr:ABC transporter permease [Candidatus Limnocylindrales bacterium]